MKSLIKKAGGLVLAAMVIVGLASCQQETETKYVDKLVYQNFIEPGTYTVYHLKQNTTGGKAIANYTLESADTESDKVLTENTYLDTLKKTYEGFTAVALAQNGTAVYVFYDRNTITYTFKTGTDGAFSDGTTEKTVSGLYGASVEVSETPSKAGYYFKKWTTTEDFTVNLFGAEDCTFTATWIENTGKYSSCVVGDIILKDGTAVSYNDFDSDNQQAAAVIVRAATDTTPALGVGIVHNTSGLAWCTESANGYSTNITGLQGTTTSGYMDGSDSWSILQATCTDATEENAASLYPAWNFCLTYGTTNSLGDSIKDGWYLPAMAELYTIYQNKTTVEASLTKAGGNTFGSGWYWSCCQSASDDYFARLLGFFFGSSGGYSKYLSNGYVCSVRAFNQ